MKTGEIIRNLRKRGQMTQKELALRLGVTVQAVSLWETGIAHPSLSCVKSMAELFGVSSDLLLGLPRKTLADPTETETFRELFRGFLAALTGRLGNRLTPDAAHILRDWVHTLWDGDREADELLSGLDVCEARHYTERGEYAQAAMLLRRAQEKKS